MLGVLIYTLLYGGLKPSPLQSLLLGETAVFMLIEPDERAFQPSSLKIDWIYIPHWIYLIACLLAAIGLYCFVGILLVRLPAIKLGVTGVQRIRPLQFMRVHGGCLPGVTGYNVGFCIITTLPGFGDFRTVLASLLSSSPLRGPAAPLLYRMARALLSLLCWASTSCPPLTNHGW